MLSVTPILQLLYFILLKIMKLLRQTNLTDYIENNVKRLKFILSNTRSKLIYASSVAIYGDLSVIPHSPSDELNIINTYSKSKFECEKLVLQAGGVVARLSNIYGPGMSKKKNIISDILKQIKLKA